MSPTFAAVPVLRVFDVEKAREFYVGYLGFHVDWQHRFVIDPSGNRLRFSEPVAAPTPR